MTGKISTMRGWIAVAGLSFLTAGSVWGQVHFYQPPPDSYYKEYGRVQSRHELLVTDPHATATGAQDYLPNPVLYFTIDDLQDAKDEVV